jgi:hypothetical protein
MKARMISVIAMVMALTQMIGCSRAQVEIQEPRGIDSGLTSTTQRIVEIDRLLSAPLTGQTDDADQRATLRAERAALTGSYNNNGSRGHPVITRQQPEAPPQNQRIVVARDSQGDHSPHQMSALEAMTPTERARYYKELRLQNQSTVIVVPREHRGW